MAFATLLFLKKIKTMLRFKINKITGCWEWQGHLDKDGYGSIKIGQVTYRVHRIAYLILNGFIKSSKQMVCHTCDNPPCMNPQHLFLGTAKDNAQDRQKKGRTVMPDVKGENHPKARLTDNDISNIRTSGLSNIKLAKIYNLKSNYIQKIKSGERRK